VSANERLFDATVRHATAVRRFSTGEAKQVLELVDRSNTELAMMFNRRLEKGDFTSRRYQKLLDDGLKLRQHLWNDVLNGQRQRLFELSKVEQTKTREMLNESLGFELNYAAMSPDQLRAIVNSRPFSGGPNAARTLDQWWRGLGAVDQGRIIDAVSLGMAQAETIDQVVRRLRKATDLTRRNAEAVARTAVNHVSNSAREGFFQENDDVIAGLRWTSMLDGRTSLVCAGRDGHFAPPRGKKSTEGVPRPWLKPMTARPPAHPNCRSVMVGVLDSNGVEQKMPDRPYVRDTRTRRQREIDFRAQAKAEAGAQWKNMTVEQRNAHIRDIRQQWTREHVGTVPGKMNYDQWLRRQPDKFQNEVLGPERAKMFRNGMGVEEYTDRTGDVLTLKELGGRVPDEPVPTEWTADAQTEWEEDLGLEDMHAIQSWTGSKYPEMRAVQRGRTWYKDGDRVIDMGPDELLEARRLSGNLNRALDEAPPFRSDWPLFRGMGLTPENLKKLAKGEYIELKAMASSSIHSRTAHQFAARHIDGERLPVMLRVRNNQTGVSIMNVSGIKTEGEVLLRKGARYRVVDTKYHPTGLMGMDQEWYEVIVDEETK
jgi:SPP1 gp7 family putative phage head morphogenesis protein